MHSTAEGTPLPQLHRFVLFLGWKRCSYCKWRLIKVMISLQSPRQGSLLAKGRRQEKHHFLLERSISLSLLLLIIMMRPL